jgi:hypothetical protein
VKALAFGGGDFAVGLGLVFGLVDHGLFLLEAVRFAAGQRAGRDALVGCRAGEDR